jgi:3-phytase/alkaline phosphatase D
VAADLHGTLVNNLAYQTAPLGGQNFVDAFEIVTGPVAYDAPLGPTAVDIAFRAGLIDQGLKDFYDGLDRAGKDVIVEILGNFQMGIFGYDPFGLSGSSIDAQLLFGRYVAAHVYGWTEFEIEPTSQRLTVTVWGIEPYTANDLASDPDGVLARVPQVVSRFRVTPK